MTLSGDSRLSDPERNEAPYWVRISLFVLIMRRSPFYKAPIAATDHVCTLPEIAAFGLFVDPERLLV